MSLFIDVVRLPHSAGLPLPDYATDGAAAVDLIAAIPEDAPVIDPALIDQDVRPSIHRRKLGLSAPRDSRQ